MYILSHLRQSITRIRSSVGFCKFAIWNISVRSVKNSYFHRTAAHAFDSEKTDIDSKLSDIHFFAKKIDRSCPVLMSPINQSSLFAKFIKIGENMEFVDAREGWGGGGGKGTVQWRENEVRFNSINKMCHKNM